jgi:hypothetical protein
MQQIDLEIVNFDKYNPRGDVKKHSWFRFENALLESADFYSFTGEEIKAFLYLLSQASRKRTGKIRVIPDHAMRACMIKPKDLHAAIAKLEALQVVHVHGTSTSRARDAHVALRTDGRTNDTDGRTDAPTAPPPAELSLVRNPQAGKILAARGVTQAQFDAWLAAYPNQAWVEQEILKAVSWESGDPTRHKKKFAAFIANWLSKGFAAGEMPVRSAPAAPKPKPPEEPFDYGPPDPESAARIRALVNGGLKDMPR